MDKETFISNKIATLMREGKYTHPQAIAIAFSMYENRDKAQLGTITPPFESSLEGNPMANYSPQYKGAFGDSGIPYFDYNKVDPSTYNNYQALTPNGVSLDVNNLNTNTNIPNQELSQRMAENKVYNTATNNYDENGNAINTNNPTYEDYMRLKLANPYGGVNLEGALFFAGQGFGKGNVGEGLLGATTAGLKGARTFLSGMGAGKENKRAEMDMLANLYKQPNYKYGQVGNNAIYKEGGETPTNADMMTGAYVTDMPNANIEVEAGEHIKNSQTGEVQEAVGKKHADGGIDVNLPPQSKVLSDFTKIGAQNAKKFKEQFGVEVKASNTFSDVMDKVNKKIGFTKLIEEEKEYTSKIEKQLTASVDEATKKVNLNFLSKEIEKLQKEKASVKQLQDQAFEQLFHEQEKIPKTQTVNKQEGGLQIGQEESMEGQASNPQEEQGEITPEQILQMFSQITQQDPQEVAKQLQAMNPEEQQKALEQMLQVVKEKQLPKAEGGGITTVSEGYSFPTTYVPTVNGYDIKSTPIIDQSTLSDVERNQVYKEGKGYGNKMQDVEKTINTHKWYFDTEAKKKAFREAVTKKGKQPEVEAFQIAYNNELKKRAEKAGIPKEETDRIISEVGFTDSGVQNKDGLFGAFTSTRPLYEISKKQGQAEVKPVAGVTATDNTVPPHKTAREVVKTVNADLPVNFNLPPDALKEVYKPGINLSRLDAIKISPESNLAQIEASRLASTEALNFLPENQKASAMANMLGTSQASANQAIGQTTVANTQTQGQIDQYNAGQSDKEQLMNINLAKDYETKMLGAERNTSIDLRRFYNQLNAENRQNFADVSNLNLVNAMTPNYQTNGSDVYFNNAPVNVNNSVVDPEIIKIYKETEGNPALRTKYLAGYESYKKSMK